jgi:hypothetical protein
MSLAALLVATAIGEPVIAQRRFVYRIEASQCVGSSGIRAVTGFRVRGQSGIVTALHGVAGCREVRATSEYGQPPIHPLTISKVNIEADAALLVSEDFKDEDGIEIGEAIEEGSLAWTLGYPLKMGYHSVGITIGSPAERTLSTELQSLSPETFSRLRDRKSPNIAQKVLSIQGSVVPGHSGAPVVDPRGRLLGIAIGGLGGGTLGFAWAIPYSRSFKWDLSLDLGRLDQLSAQTASLFSLGDPNDRSVVPPSACDLIQKALVAGQRGFVDLIGKPIGDRIESTLNLPGALYTTVAPEKYLTGRVGLIKGDSEPPPEAQVIYYRFVNSLSACLPGWRTRKERSRLAIQFESEQHFVARAACDTNYYRDEKNEVYVGHLCTIALYPPSAGGARSAELRRPTFDEVLNEMVEHARFNFVSYGRPDQRGGGNRSMCFRAP